MATDTDFKRKLFNKGSRKIDHSRGSLLPQKAEAFSEDEAKKLLRLFKSELIDMDNVTVESLTTAGVGDTVKKQADNDQAEIARRLADARVLRKQKAYENAIKEGFDEAEAREIAGLDPVAAPADEKEDGKKEDAADKE